MNLTTSLLTTLFLLEHVLVHALSGFAVYHGGLTETRACHMALQESATFCTNQSNNSYVCYCSNMNAMASLVGCAKNLSPYTQTFDDFFIGYCAKQNASITRATIDTALQYLADNGRAANVSATLSNSLLLNSSSPKSNWTGAGLSSGNSLAAGSIDFSRDSVVASTKLAADPMAWAGPASTNSTSASPPAKPKTARRIDYPIFVNSTRARSYYEAYDLFYGNFNWSYWFSGILYAY